MQTSRVYQQPTLEPKVQRGPILMFHENIEGSRILGSGLKSTLPEAEIMASSLTYRPLRARVRALILFGAPYDLAATVFFLSV